MLDHLPRCRAWLRRLRQCRGGNSSVEFALAVPVLILVTFAAFDYGSAYVEGVRLNGAARAGAQQVLFDPVDWQNTARVEQAALEEYVGHELSADEAGALPVSAAASAFCACTAGAVLACGDLCPGGASPGSFVQVTLTRGVPLTLPYPWTNDGQVSVQGGTVVRVR